MTDREKLAEEIEGIPFFGTFTTPPDAPALRRQCVETIINARLGGHNIEETIRRADMLYRYITNGEIPVKKKAAEHPAPLPPITPDEPATASV